MTTVSPETRPVPLVVIDGTIVHRASAVRQVAGPRHPAPMRHSTTNRVTPQTRPVSPLLDQVIRAIAAAIVVVEVVKTGAPWWLVARLADGLMVAVALTGR